MEATKISAPANSMVIDINAWNAMTPEQRAALPQSVQAMFQPAAAAQPQITVNPSAIGPNQDIVIPPAPVPVEEIPVADPSSMTLSERKEIRRGAIESCPAGSRAWYQAWEVSFTDPNDISAMIAGIAIGVVAVAIIGGIVYLVKKQ